MEILAWVVDGSQLMPDGPFVVIRKTKNGLVQFAGRKAAKRLDVFYSEKKALERSLYYLDSRKASIERNIERIENKLFALNGIKPDS